HSLASTSAGSSIPAASRNRPASIHVGRSIPTASQNRPASIHAGRFIPAASRNRPASIHASRHIPTGRINKPAPFPAGRSVPTGWTNPAARLFFGPTNLYFDNVYWPGIYDHMSMNTGRWGSAVKSSADIGIVDSGCSRSMTGNKEKLDDFVQVKGGTVTFGGGDGLPLKLFTNEHNCVACNKGKQHKASYKAISAVGTISEPLQLLHMDLFGLTSIRSIDHKYYSLVVTDDFSRCDNGTEFRNAKLIALCREKGIKRDYSNARTLQQNGVTERKNRTLIEAARSMLADSKLPTMFWTEAVSTACYVLNRVSITNPHNKTPYELLSGKAARSMLADSNLPTMFWTEAVSTACYVLNRVSITNPHNKTPYELLSGKLGKFKGKANDGFLVGYAAHSKAYRVCNLSSKKVEETLNLRYLEDKPNVHGLGQEWYFDLDYLTDSLGYTRFKTNPPAGIHDTNIIAGTQDDDSETECDEQVILVPSFPSNSFSGPKVHNVSAPMENNLDYAEELARLQRQEHEAHSAAAKYGFEFSDETAEMLHPAEIETCRNLVLDAGDPAGSIVSTGGVPAGSVPAGSVPTSSVPAGSVPAGSVPASHVPTSSIPAGGVLAGSIDSAGFGDPAASESVPAIFTTDHAAVSPLPPGHSLGSSEHSTRFSSLSDLENHQPTAGIFSSSSYDDDVCADVTNLTLNVDVDPVATKRVNTIHPQSQIIGELQSPVQTRSTMQKSKFSESAFISYVHNQNRTNHADYLHCLFACFISQLEPSSVAKALADPDWVAAIQEEMQ
nr:hypothetical protein [Tanacetum cinerariifolium]